MYTWILDIYLNLDDYVYFGYLCILVYLWIGIKTGKQPIVNLSHIPILILETYFDSRAYFCKHAGGWGQLNSNGIFRAGACPLG